MRDKLHNFPQSNMDPSIPPSISSIRSKKPCSVMTRPLPSAALRPIVEASLIHKLTSPYSLSLSLSICNSLSAVHLFMWLSWSVSHHHASFSFRPFPFVSLSFYLFSVFTVHLLLCLQPLTGSGSVSGYQRKLRFCC